MTNSIEIYTSSDNQTEVSVLFEGETVWLNRHQISELFGRDIKTIGKHINNVFAEGELEERSVVAKIATTAADGKIYQVEHYNLDVIISVGYRVKSVRGTQFRQWATRRLKEYLVEGYILNEKRLAEKQMQVETLKTGIRILSRALEEYAGRTDDQADAETLRLFAEGLTLLDDYDHETLDSDGKTHQPANYPTKEEYLQIIHSMQSAFASDVFAKPKDNGFESAIEQIRQSFGGVELYPSLEEKAATLLYLIVKNHAFADGNKRIGAACFLTFLERNHLLRNADNTPIISNDALAALTLFVASSKREEMETVKRVIVSILNRA